MISRREVPNPVPVKVTLEMTEEEADILRRLGLCNIFIPNAVDGRRGLKRQEVARFLDDIVAALDHPA